MIRSKTLYMTGQSCFESTKALSIVGEGYWSDFGLNDVFEVNQTFSRE